MSTSKTKRFLKLMIGAELKYQIVSSIKERRGPADVNRDFKPVAKKDHSVKPIKVELETKDTTMRTSTNS